MGSNEHGRRSSRDDRSASASERRQDREVRRRSRSPVSPRKRPRHEEDDEQGGHRYRREHQGNGEHREHRDYRESRDRREHRDDEHRHRREHRDRDGDRRHRSSDEDDEAYERRRRRRHHDDDSDVDGDTKKREHRDRRDRHDRHDRHERDRPAAVRQRGPLPDQAASFALMQGGEDGAAVAEKVVEKEKPNLQATGVLAAESNTVVQADGSVTTLKYHEPPEARKPPARDVWTLFIFKKQNSGAKEEDVVEAAPPIPLSARSCWLVGRDAAVADVVAAHPSVSGQHAVVQFRYRERRNEYGERQGKVRPYLLDLASANGTQLNHEPVAAQRFVELRSGDVVTLGSSTREYVVVLAPREKEAGK